MTIFFFRSDFETECPALCECKWRDSKKHADCKSKSYTTIPQNLHNEVQVGKYFPFFYLCFLSKYQENCYACTNDCFANLTDFNERQCYYPGLGFNLNHPWNEKLLKFPKNYCFRAVTFDFTFVIWSLLQTLQDTFGRNGVIYEYLCVFGFVRVGSIPSRVL